MPPRQKVSARITGKVQGVAYRAWTQSRARHLALTGYVQNEPSGSVRAVFEGDRKAVQQMITDLWEGPGAASVTDVQTETLPHGKTLDGNSGDTERDGFHIRYGVGAR